ncbi:MAG: peptide chain release factor N(5)-glutamine methyltransferase [Alphaproteobacteria bacterium]
MQQVLTRGQARRRTIEALQSIPDCDAKTEADWLIKHLIGDVGSLLLTADEPMTLEQQSRLEHLVSKRLAREPLSRVLGVKNFWRHEFQINQHVLDPRADSEVLVEQALNHIPINTKAAILDLGTGSGCLLLSVLADRPTCQGLGVDVSVDALQVAKANAKQLGLDARANFQQGSWATGLEQKFDLVLCNPPYIDEKDKSWMSPEVLGHDPHIALFADNQGLKDFDLIFAQLPTILKDDGLALLEHGFDQRGALVDLAHQHGLTVSGTYDDLGGNARCIALKL